MSTSTAGAKNDIEIGHFVKCDNTLYAEMMFTLHTVYQHCSFKSIDVVTYNLPQWKETSVRQ